MSEDFVKDLVNWQPFFWGQITGYNALEFT